MGIPNHVNDRASPVGMPAQPYLHCPFPSQRTCVCVYAVYVQFACSLRAMVQLVVTRGVVCGECCHRLSLSSAAFI